MEIHSAVVIGASRGLGLAITEEILSMESIQSVTASYRSEDTAEALCALEDPRLRRLPLEVTDEASFERVRPDSYFSSINPLPQAA